MCELYDRIKDSCSHTKPGAEMIMWKIFKSSVKYTEKVYLLFYNVMENYRADSEKCWVAHSLNNFPKWQPLIILINQSFVKLHKFYTCLLCYSKKIQCKGMLFIRFLLEHVFLVMSTKLKLLNCSTISKHCHLKIRHINPNYQNMRKKRYQVTLWLMLLI